MKFVQLIFLVVTLTLGAAQYDATLDDADITIDKGLRQLGKLGGRWWDELWVKIKGALIQCPPCEENFIPNQWSTPHCKCYFNTRITVEDRNCCIL